LLDQISAAQFRSYAERALMPHTRTAARRRLGQQINMIVYFLSTRVSSNFAKWKIKSIENRLGAITKRTQFARLMSALGQKRASDGPRWRG